MCIAWLPFRDVSVTITVARVNKDEASKYTTTKLLLVLLYYTKTNRSNTLLKKIKCIVSFLCIRIIGTEDQLKKLNNLSHTQRLIFTAKTNPDCKLFYLIRNSELGNFTGSPDAVCLITWVQLQIYGNFHKTDCILNQLKG